MSGFFSSTEVTSSTRRVKQETCVSCGLYKTVRTPRMEPYGKGRLGIMTCGEAPGESEDKRGRQWQGKTGQKLQEACTEIGIDLFDDCISTNSIMCRPMDNKGNRPPTPKEISCCRPRVLKQIEDIKPKVIVLLGGSAVSSLIGHRWKKDLGGIFKWRGFTIPDRNFNAWVCPVFHPSYVERGDREVETIWIQDLERAFKMYKTPFPKWHDEKDDVKIIDDMALLQTLDSPVVIDYETNCLKPHKQESEIKAMAACDGKKCFAFVIPKDKKQMRLLMHFLKSDREFIAQNMKFEDSWTFVKFNYKIRKWLFDTMLATHILDNRPSVTGLKFQTYIQFGVADYSSEIESYLKGSDSKCEYSLNRVDDLMKTKDGLQKLLIYCGLDTIYTHKLALIQMKQIGI